jgi:hypothetical protein
MFGYIHTSPTCNPDLYITLLSYQWSRIDPWLIEHTLELFCMWAHQVRYIFVKSFIFTFGRLCPCRHQKNKLV